MLTLISCAKMFRKADSLDSLARLRSCSTPRFLEQSQSIAQAVLDCPVESLQKQLKIKSPAALLLKEQLQNFPASGGAPALLAYHGVAFKSVAPELFEDADWQSAQSQLRICSFLYGLLRPLDAIAPYRLEGSFRLGPAKGENIFNFWSTLLTDVLIADAQAQGGVLCMLASKEMEGLFDWPRVCKELCVIRPDFLIEEKGKRRVCSVRSKQARGCMASMIVRHQWKSADNIATFTEMGFALVQREENSLLFVTNVD